MDVIDGMYFQFLMTWGIQTLIVFLFQWYSCFWSKFVFYLWYFYNGSLFTMIVPKTISSYDGIRVLHMSCSAKYFQKKKIWWSSTVFLENVLWESKILKLVKQVFSYKIARTFLYLNQKYESTILLLRDKSLRKKVSIAHISSAVNYSSMKQFLRFGMLNHLYVMFLKTTLVAETYLLFR